MLLVPILMLVSACETRPVADSSLNPFCVVVGPLPPRLVPPPGAAPAWEDDYLATFAATCR